MKVDFVRFTATDGVELQGWLSDTDGDTVVLHIHGMSGNGYSNRMIDAMRIAYAKQSVAMFAINTRGNGTVTEMKKNGETDYFGSCYELFEESEYDIAGAVAYLESIGKKRIILQGHSLGCSKVVNYLQESSSTVVGAILLAPTDMVKFAESHQEHSELFQKAMSFVDEGNNGRELVGQSCWLNKTPISAATYLSLSTPGSTIDIYSDANGPTALQQMSLPAIIVYGTADVGIHVVDGTMEAYTDRVNSLLHENTTVHVIDDGNHWFGDHIDQVVDTISRYIDTLGIGS